MDEDDRMSALPSDHPRQMRPHSGDRRRTHSGSIWRDIVTPSWIIGFARRLFLVALGVIAAMALVPWPQAAPARGTVTVLDPRGRDQSVQAPIDGFVATWAVMEGQDVTEGDLLVALRDNDPDLLDRLTGQRATVEAQVRAAESKVTATEQKVVAATLTRDADIAAARADLAAAEREVEAARADLAAARAESFTATIQGDRALVLVRDGFTSEQEAENRTLKAQTASAKVDAAEAKVVAMEAKRDATRAKVEAVERKGEGNIAEAEGQRMEAIAKLEETRAKLLDAQSKVVKQATQEVRAPFTGRVVRVFGGAVGEQVKKGDNLVRLVPHDAERFVELKVDGWNAALVQPGQEARIQFEGWPALQFAGWPAVAPGTFAGRVRVVDPVADLKGNVRLLVEPEENPADGHAWPPPERLPQGLRATGWIILGEVPLGYEIWRRLNDFPPIVDPPEKGEQRGPVDASKARKAWSPK